LSSGRRRRVMRGKSVASIVDRVMLVDWGEALLGAGGILEKSLKGR
jgi:hypothetical protein